SKSSSRLHGATRHQIWACAALVDRTVPTRRPQTPDGLFGQGDELVQVLVLVQVQVQVQVQVLVLAIRLSRSYPANFIRRR
ncbi:MAG: hypothetical protein PHC30_08130, partial [Lentisphaeria bacterium]|nr:hypothetical protein [Lentisphaeria bacterium]